APCEMLRQRKTQIRPARLGMEDAGVFHRRLKAATDGFDFGKLGQLEPFGSLLPPVIAPVAPARYGPGAKAAMTTDRSADTHFGFRTVPLEEKQALVDDVFHKVARRYDLMNDLMSGGLHRVWKDTLVSKVRPPKTSRPFRLLDLAGGTGDVSFRVIEAGGAGTHATVADINAPMLEVGRERAAKRGFGERVEFVEANAEALAFPDKCFDAVTIAFGIRNVPQIGKALAEIRRVLKTGGHFLCLEFSPTAMPGLDAL